MASNSQMLKIVLKFQDQASKEFDKIASKVDKLGDKMNNVGKKMSLAVTAPVVAFGALSIKAATDFESAFAGVIKTVDGTDAQLNKLRDTIRDMATSSTNPLAGLENAHETLAGIMELGGQLGVPIDQLDNFTQVVGELGMSTNLTTDEAALMSAQFANITGMDFDNFRKFGSTIVDLGNNLATTEKDIMQFAQRLAGIGNTAGLSEQRILAISGAMASMGLNAEAGASAMTKTFTEIISAVGKGGDQLDRFAEVAGMTAKEFSNEWQKHPQMALLQFLKGLGKLDQAAQTQALEDLNLDGLRVADTMRRMSSNTDLLAKSFDIAWDAWDEGSALADEAQQRFETTEAQWNLFKNTINDLAIAFGDILLPVVNSVLGFITPLVQAFADMPEPMQKVITVIAALAATIGPLLIVGSKLIGLFAGIGPAIQAAAMAFTMLNPVILAVVATLGVVAFTIVQIIQHWEEIKNVVGAFGEVLSTVWNRIKEGMSHWGPVLKKIGELILKGLVELFKGMAIELYTFGKLLVEGLVKGIYEGGKAVVDGITDVVSDGVNSAKDFLGIASPSRVTYAIGQSMGAGLAEGFQQSGAMQSIVSNVARGAQAMSGMARSAGRSAGKAAGATIRTGRKSAPKLANTMNNFASAGNMNGGFGGMGGGFGGMGGFNNMTPQAATPGAGAGLYINGDLNINVPPGTTEEQVNIIAKELGRRAQQRGAFGLK